MAAAFAASHRGAAFWFPAPTTCAVSRRSVRKPGIGMTAVRVRAAVSLPHGGRVFTNDRRVRRGGSERPRRRGRGAPVPTRPPGRHLRPDARAHAGEQPVGRCCRRKSAEQEHRPAGGPCAGQACALPPSSLSRAQTGSPRSLSQSDRGRGAPRSGAERIKRTTVGKVIAASGRAGVPV